MHISHNPTDVEVLCYKPSLTETCGASTSISLNMSSYEDCCTGIPSEISMTEYKLAGGMPCMSCGEFTVSLYEL